MKFPSALVLAFSMAIGLAACGDSGGGSECRRFSYPRTQAAGKSLGVGKHRA